MQQALVSDVLPWLEEPAATCDRSKLIEYLNRARERMYQLYPEIALFEIIECFEPQVFCTDCNNCIGQYTGVTLPRDHQTVEAMWLDDTPVELFSSWREWQRGITPHCDCGLSKYDMPGVFPTERDLFPGTQQRLKVAVTSAADVGKKVTVSGTDEFGNSRDETLSLGVDPVFTEAAFRSLRRFTKERTAAVVVLADETGRILSRYAPDETFPCYRRIKITGLRNCDRRVNIRSARQFFPVYRDSDVVETNNRAAFENIVRFLRIDAKANKTGEDIRNAGYHMTQGLAALKGEKSREIGKSTRVDLAVRTPSFGPRQLGRRW